MIRKTKEQQDIHFLTRDDELTKNANIAEDIVSSKKNIEDMSDRELLENNKGMKFSDVSFINRNGKTIMSAQAGELTDIGGSKNQMRTQSSNSIFDSEILNKLGKVASSKEETQKEKIAIEENRNNKEKERMSALAENINNINIKKGNSMFRNGDDSCEEISYKKASTSMSIFDNLNFENLPNMTEGEKLSQDTISRKKEKDESWRNSGKSDKVSNTKIFDW